MAYNQNGQHYYGNAHHQSSQSVDQFGRRIGAYNNAGSPSQGYEAGMNSAGSQHAGVPYQQGYGNYPQAPGTYREQAAYGGPGMPPSQHAQPIPTGPMSPAFPQAQSPIPNHQAYNPQNYAQPSTQYNPQAYTALQHRPHSQSTPQPYNPAAYPPNPPNAYPNHQPTSYSPSQNPHRHATYPSPPMQGSPALSQQSFANDLRAAQYGHGSGTPPTAFPGQPSSAPLPPNRPSAYTPPTQTVSASANPPYPSEEWGAPPVSYPPTATYQAFPQSSLPSLPNERSLPSPPVSQDHGYHSSGAISERQTPSPFVDQPDTYPSDRGPPPPQHSPQRMNTLNRHPQQRPLPGPPPQSDSDEEYFANAMGRSNGHGMRTQSAEEIAQEDLFNQVESALAGAERSDRLSYQQRSPRIEIEEPGHGAFDGPRPLFSHNNYRANDPRNGATGNGHLTPEAVRGARQEYSDESDIEAAAGLEALREAEKQDAADEARRRSGGSGLFTSYSSQQNQSRPSPGDVSDGSDYAAVDMSLLGGGYQGHLSYGGDPATLATAHGEGTTSGSLSQPASSTGSMRRSNDQGAVGEYMDHSIHPFPPFSTAARVDAFGTGGLAEPNERSRRLSYDEGDEAAMYDPGDSSVPTSGISEPPDMFFSPGMSLNRPLPPPPPGEGQPHPQFSPMHLETGDRLSTASTLVPRSTSLLNHSNTPQVVQPMRSKTDAEERRIRQQGIRSSVYSGYDSSTPPSASAVALDLPALPSGKRFNPSKLGPNDFKKCLEPWALSSVTSWLKSMAEGEADLRSSTIVEGLVALFTFKVPTMNIADAETLSSRVVQEMFKAGVLVHEEEWLKFGKPSMTGVLYQLTGQGCYAPLLHSASLKGRCYSHHCQRTLKKVDLHAQPQRQSEDWATYYSVKKEDIEGIHKKEVERQNILHEIVQTEDGFMEQLNVLRVLYRDALAKAQPPVITPQRTNSFLRDVFGRVDPVKKANEDYLLAQLKYRQQEQGPWIVGFSDIFREWIRKAKNAYLDYAASFPNANFLVRQEAERNMLFRSFLDQARSHKMSNKLGWDTYLKAPITRLQRYGLLLSTVYKNMIQDSEEKSNLQTAIDEIKAVTLDCDARVAEMSRKVELADLSSKLRLRQDMKKVELNLEHLGRELIFKGDLQRTGANRFTWLETHALLFDHYFVLAKTITQRDSAGGLKYEQYDVSRLPIPMDLLVLESANDPPVTKSRGIGVTTVQAKPGTPNESLGRTSSNQSPGPGTLTHTNTNSSLTQVNSNGTGSTLVTNTILDNPKDDKILYPFRIKHLGKEPYTLYAPSAQNRQEWAEKIIEAKTKHAASLFAQNAEPFRLRVMADSAFAYDSLAGGPKSITIKGTPLDRAIENVERQFANAGRPAPICRARVNCATAFSQPYPGKEMIAVGTDYGVYVSEMDNPRGWFRAISVSRVTQIAVLEEFSLFLLIADKSLIAYHLDIVCPTGGVGARDESSRKAPQKLSGSRDVGFFATGKMKDRSLVFYKKREGLSSTFKVLEPVYQKATEKKSRMFKRGTTEFFRDYDEFYIPTDCYGINLFHSSLAVCTSKGFEVLTLDKKQPWSVPDLKQQHVASIAQRLQGQDPLGMFRLSDSDFVLCYEECAVYVNKHGEISRGVIMEFVGKAKSAALYGPYILLFDPDFVEIRNAQNGRLRQVIAGREVKMLDDGSMAGGSVSRTVKMVMQHPELERTQIVVELLLNEGQRD
ncbi:MAG: hypothetical protein M1822_006969 [Bathelium mastoideum]|nr:MAG: hypothetical protein M1822_006969 [Bathelium mastoideum]